METVNDIAPVYLLTVRRCFVRLTAGCRGAEYACKGYTSEGPLGLCACPIPTFTAIS